MSVVREVARISAVEEQKENHKTQSKSIIIPALLYHSVNVVYLSAFVTLMSTLPP